jgi:hypothetical protein
MGSGSNNGRHNGGPVQQPNPVKAILVLRPGQEVLNLLQRGGITSQDDVITLETLLLRDILQGNLPLAASKELRAWAELIHTSIAMAEAKKSMGEGGQVTTIKALMMEAQVTAIPTPAPAGTLPEWERLNKSDPVIIDIKEGGK